MSLNKKFLVLGVTVLFLTLVFTLATSASYTNEQNSKEKLIQIEVSEFKSDGDIENEIFSLTKTEVNNLKNELLKSKTIEKQLDILKEYGLISKETSIIDLENDMYTRASSLGIKEELSPEKTSIKLPILLKFFKKVSVVYIGGVSFDIGLKFIIRIINLLPFINLPTLDFVDICGGSLGITNTKGIFSNDTLITFPGIVGLLGFVGYRIKFPFLMQVYTGFSVVTFGFGFGIHIKD